MEKSVRWTRIDLNVIPVQDVIAVAGRDHLAGLPQTQSGNRWRVMRTQKMLMHKRVDLRPAPQVMGGSMIAPEAMA
jgi:hypothetical protein